MKHFKKTFFSLKHVLFIIVMSSTMISCVQDQVSEEEQVRIAVDIIKEHYERADPGLKLKEYKLSISVFPSVVGEVSSCVCFQVCDGNGQNCTKCECDPKGCGSC